MKTLLAVLLVSKTLLAAPIQADGPMALEIDGAEIHRGEETMSVGPGVYLNEPASIAIAQKLRLQAEQIKNLETTVTVQEAKVLPAWLLVAIAVVAAGVGAGSAIVLKK